MKTFRIKSIKNLRVASLIVFVLSCLIVPYRVKWNYKGADANATIGYHLLVEEPSSGEAMKQIEDILPDDLLGGLYESNKFDQERQQLHPFTTDLRYKYWYKKSSDALIQILSGSPDSTNRNIFEWRIYKVPESDLSLYFHDTTLARLRSEAAIYDSARDIKLKQIDIEEASQRGEEEARRFGRIAQASIASVSIDVSRLIPQILIAFVILAAVNLGTKKLSS